MATTIAISDITTNVDTTGSGSEIEVTGDGYFDDLMETINTHLKAQYDANRLTGDAYARVYMGMAQAALGQSMQFSLAKRNAELKADIATEELLKKKNEVTVSDGTVQDKIDSSSAQLTKLENEATVSTSTVQNKIDLSSAQLIKVQAEGSYIDEQETQLINSVEFNNKIKSLDSLADTYGTFGAGGLTMSSDMWGTYFSIVNDLSTASVPTSTTVTKVT